MALTKITGEGIGAIDDLTVDTSTLKVDSTNNRVGISNASPSTPLDVGGHIRVTGGNDCDIEFQSGSARRKFIGGDGNELELGTFSSSNTSRDIHMRIDSAGNLLVATTSTSPNPGVALQAGGVVGIGNSNGNSGNSFIEFRRNATQIGSVTQSGTTGVSYNTSSDHRLKENVTTDWDATNRLKQLNPVRFNFIADADITVDGFLAHEVQSVVPEAITGTHNEVDADGNPVYQGIDQSKLVPLLVKTIQELEARIVALESA